MAGSDRALRPAYRAIKGLAVGYDLKEFVKEYGFDCELLKQAEHDFALIK